MKRTTRSFSLGVIVLFVTPVLSATTAVAASGDCKFKQQPPVTLQSMGPCQFDRDTLSFAGDPSQQARCLLTPVGLMGKLGAPLGTLPAVFAERVGTPHDLPSREDLLRLLQQRGQENDFAPAIELGIGLARANDNDPAAPAARYFVIHDTSSPNYRAKAFPADIDTRKLNLLGNYRCSNRAERAHIFINRMGQILLAHDLAVAWRATKFEMAQDFGGALKGLFLHIELVQPRRRHPRYGARNDYQAPSPGFTPGQYEGLALIYTVASVRAGAWMIPAFHAVVDEGIRNKHDDPQNFDLAAFAETLALLLDALHGRRNGNLVVQGE